MREEKINCYRCKEHIDRGACDIEYTIITIVNNRPSPIEKKRIYLCERCTNLFLADLTRAKIKEEK